MWKALLLFAFAADVILVTADGTVYTSATATVEAGWEGDTAAPTQETADAADTVNTPDTADTRDTSDTQDTEETGATGSRTVDASATAAVEAGWEGDTAAPTQETADAADTVNTPDTADTRDTSDTQDTEETGATGSRTVYTSATATVEAGWEGDTAAPTQETADAADTVNTPDIGNTGDTSDTQDTEETGAVESPTPPCPEGENYDECPTVKCEGDYCPKTRDSPLTCPVGIVCDPPRCVCGFNSRRDRKTGKCIATANCPPFACNGPNEEYQPCPATCPGEKCSDYINNSTCPPFRIGIVVPCKPQCKCKKGYYRNDDGICIIGYKCDIRAENGTCVPKDQCPGTRACGGDPNAKPGCGVNCGKTCSTYKTKNPACPLFCNVNGCDCKDGFVFDPNQQKCVLPQDCTPTCGANEVFSTCTNGGCDARNCSQVGKPVPCVKIDPKYCIKGCVCDTGYLRASNGICVPKDQCGGGGGACGGDPNAKPGCGVNCGKTCSTYKAKNPICPRICKVNGCDCKDGFVFDPNQQKCILPQDCTPTCGANEVFSTCTNGGCDARNCSQVGKPVPCVKIDPKYCIKGCVCDTGYLRASNGICVPKDQCGGGGGCGGDPNAEPGCGINCGRTCTTYKSKTVACPAICVVGGCDCKKGFVFDDVVKKCVLPADCSPRCGPNEIVSTCSNGGCGPFKCSDLGKPILCIDPINCTKGCVCQNTYLRAEDGTCVPKDQCPGTCGGDPNAKPGCGVNCGKTCSTYKAKNPICPLLCKVNGCDCKDGFVFDPNQQKCVLPQDCTPTCGANEVFSTCTNGGCDARNCSQVGKPVPCVKIDPKYCIKGCVCDTGYLRASNGICVPKDQCGGGGAPRCGPNEIVSTCSNGGCGPFKCSDLGKPILCIDPINCTKGCVCQNTYLRAEDGTCVPKDQCPGPCGGDPNAKPGCGVNCGKTCSTYKTKNPICPRICKVNGCDCKDGFVFNPNQQKCVLPQYCTKCPNPNEVFDVCPAPCPPRRCDVDDRLIRCAAPPKPGDPDCKPGCRCADNYAQNAKGICVPRSECDNPVNKCRENEVFNSCLRTCPPQKCGIDPALVLCANPGPEVKCQPGCECVDGYVRNDTDVCIPKDQCPICTGQNEFFDLCISGCGSQNCSDIGKIFHCPIQPAVCRTGCRCNPGFYRNTDNVCVPESECPTPPCPEGEIYNRCPTVKCEGDYCPKTRDSPLTCPVGIVCDPPRCVCGFNSRRDRKTGKCIATANCPPFACNGPNEEYQPCPATCPGEKCSDYINNSTCPPFRIGIVVPCKPQCKCKKGYYRNDDNVCVIGYKCGPKNNDTTAAPTTTKPNDGGDGSGSVDITSLQAGIADFTGKFLYDRMQASKGENVIISPFSVFTPLAQLALYAVGEALKQLLAILHLNSKDEIRTKFPTLVASYEGQTSVNFSQAALVCFNKKTPANYTVKKDSIDIFHAETRDIDFSDVARAAAEINSWVASKTDNHITDLVSRDMFNSGTRIALINAILFQGTWVYQFDKKNTQDQDFYLEDGTKKKTKLMYQEAKFNYGEFPEYGCKMIEMGYVGQNFSMVAVLPDRIDGVTNLAKTLQDFTIFYKLYSSLTNQKVKVWFPKFEIRTTTDLAEILKQQNVDKIFNETDSQLRDIIANQKENVCVTAAVQKAVVIVEEKGSEAYAANGVIGRSNRPAPPPPPSTEFRADHGFIFHLRVHSTSVFCGVYVN